MNNILNIASLTLKEAIARKIFLWFLGISTFLLLCFAGIFSFVRLEDLTGMVNLKNNAGDQVNTLISNAFKLFIVGYLYFIGFILSIISTSSFIPNMLEKGNIDLLLSKPISRMQLILGKYVGGVLVVLLNIFYLIIGIWLLIGLKFTVWDINFLFVILTVTYTFAVLYSFIILIGIITSSSILAMMLSFLSFFIFSPLLAVRDKFLFITDNKVLEAILGFFYYITPQTSELESITSDLAAGGGIGDFEPIITSYIFMILSIVLSIIIFSKKDY